MNYDVVVIGGGIVGSAIIHKLSIYDMKIALLEKEPDLCEGISKANSAIIHTGFDALAGSLEAKVIRRANELWPSIIKNHKLAFEKRGAVMVATNEEEKKKILDKYLTNAKENNVDVRWVSKEEILKDNPAVTQEAIGGLFIEGESIVDPWDAVYKFAEIAEQNGADILLNKEVKHITSTAENFTLMMENGEEIKTKYVINAAGLYSDAIASMIGDDSFSITPRKGQFIVTKDKVDIKNIILPVPSKKSKGKLITPAVFKGHLLGPTAEDIHDKTDCSTTEEGFKEIREECGKLIPVSKNYTSVKQYAGLRAVCSESDYIIRKSVVNPRMIHAAGIRSTGLSASPGIAEYVADILIADNVNIKKKEQWKPGVTRRIRSQADDNEIICLTRNITKGDVRKVMQMAVRPNNLDGIKRRTTALLGECQGSCCIPKILDIMEEFHLEGELMKSEQHSFIGYKI
ncbi:NAD(P)/FAD-dependent oxidoreductase [Oceanobacillus jeddahense]|uniref:NAD(P)/FAD-dependent oxidoreductase n=1 Tax=Oceanobacillus jeddahense TaxID=1462527 RepID=A0ABY5JVL3_9BACI|nr:NAD(P)/FAD-dependent oxidoreductase [Oceanobacillus jeddahense]UUI02902.1 NAD(P)/FAD-dependent oxidoreductase [Oceanobacillus jeddahense]